MICIPKLALEIQDLLLPAIVLSPRLDNTIVKLKISAIFLCVISLGCQTGQFLSYYAQKIDISLEANGCQIFGWALTTSLVTAEGKVVSSLLATC